MLRRLAGPLLVLASTLSVQIGIALSVRLFDRLGAAATGGLRYTLVAVLMLAAVRPRVRGRSRGEWVAILAFGVVLACMNLTFYQAISRIPLGTTVAIEFCGPLTVAALASRSVRDVAWVVLAAVGVFVLAGPTPTTNLGGLAWAVLAACGWAAYVFGARRVGSRTSGVEGLALALGVAALITVPLWLPRASLIGPREYSVAAVSGILGIGIAFALELEALRLLQARAVSVLFSLEPVVALGVGLVVLGQRAGWLDLAGAACVVIAGVGVSGSGSA